MGTGNDGMPKISVDSAVIEKAREAREAAIDAEIALKDAIRERAKVEAIYTEMNNAAREAENNLNNAVIEEQRYRDELLDARKNVIKTTDEAFRAAKKDLQRAQKRVKNTKAKLDRALARVE